MKFRIELAESALEDLQWLKGSENMKAIELPGNQATIEQLLEWASEENVLIRRNGEVFILVMVDDFEVEVESLRHNDEFIAFLDARAAAAKISIEEAKKRLLEQD